MKATMERFRTPSGDVVENPLTGTDYVPRGLVWKKRLKIIGLGVLVLVVLSSPIWQAFIPRGRTMFSSESEVVPSPAANDDILSYQVAFPSPTAPSTLVPSPTAPSTLVPSPTPVPVLRLIQDCDVLEFPRFGSEVVGFYVAYSVLRPSGYWLDDLGEYWFRVGEGWFPGSCTGDVSMAVVVALSVVSPPMLPVPTATLVPLVMPTAKTRNAIAQAVSDQPTPSPTITPKPRWSFQALPAGFSPGWCVAVAAQSVTLPDGSVYRPPKGDKFIYLSEGVLGQSLVIEVNGWWENFSAYECGRYQ